MPSPRPSEIGGPTEPTFADLKTHTRRVAFADLMRRPGRHEGQLLVFRGRVGTALPAGGEFYVLQIDTARRNGQWTDTVTATASGVLPRVGQHVEIVVTVGPPDPTAVDDQPNLALVGLRVLR
jgi:hypothetical protein